MTESRRIILSLFLLPFLLHLCQVPGWSKEKGRIALLMDVGFVSKQFPGNFPPMPETLNLDIYITNGAFYKLYYKGALLSSGGLKKGDNRIPFPANIVLRKSGSYVFRLETQTPEYRFLYDITIGSRIAGSRPAGSTGSKDLQEPRPAPMDLFSTAAQTPANYIIDLYVRGHRAANSRKQVFQGLPQSQRKSIRNILGIKPHGSVMGYGNPRANSQMGLSIPALAAMLYNKLKKKKKIRLPKSRAVPVGFRFQVTGEPAKWVIGKLAISYNVVNPKLKKKKNKKE